ncbi:unnamed protein product [Malus baccata var. baccata]
MSQLITRRRSVSNASPTLSASTAPPMSAPLIQEPTSLVEATSTASQVPVSSTSSVSDEQMKAQLRVQSEEVRTYAETVRDLSSYQHLILIHLRPQSHLTLPILSSLMF